MSELPPLPEELTERIDILCKIAGLLDVKDVTFSSISSAIDRLSDEELTLRLSNNRLNFVEQELTSNLALATHEYNLIKNLEGKLQTELASSDSPASLERRREALIRKAKELHKELEQTTAGLETQPAITISQLIQQQQNNAKREEDIRAKRIKLKAFQGLPPNLDLARHELLQAQQEQMKYFQLRERLLGTMADNVS